ncbi:MAG TPA: sigma-70 family RNA polymerase sigma factor [Planctomycetota bacterium]
MTSTSPFELEPASLLRHDQWLRALARSLVHGTDVDDLVQDTWTAALRQRPDASQPLRGWLATVLRRLASRRHRSDSRRRAREQEPRHEAQPSTEATVALLELQRAVSGAVSAMAEPYRTTILLRYFHGFDYAEIAAREAISEPAARKRVERGLELLRAQLQRRDADWKRAPAMLVLAGPSPFTLPSLLGVVAMSQAFKFTTAAVVVVALAGIVWWLQPPPSVPAPVEAAGRAELAPVPATAPAVAVTGSTPAAERVAAAPAQAEVPKPARPWRGRVLDPRGRTLGGVPIVLAARLSAEDTDAATAAQRVLLPADVRALSARPERRWNEVELARDAKPELGHSAADGSFAVFAESGYLIAGPGWTTLRSPPLPAGAPAGGLLLVATREVSVSGEVVDEAGRPLAGVRLGPDWPVLDDFPEALDATTKVAPPFAWSGPDGTFTLAGLPAGEGRIEFHRAGFLVQHADAPEATTTGLRIVMRSADSGRMVVKGVVLDHREVPVAKAVVVLEENAVHTRDDGRFELVFGAERSAPGPLSVLVAACPGHQALVVPGFGARLRDPAAREVVLRLPGPALSISGVVVDHEGKPVVDVLVYPWDEPFVLEDRTADELGMPPDAPAHQAGVPLRVAARTDADGAFTLRGLRAHGYRLHVDLKKPRAGFTSEVVTAPAGNMRLQLPEQVVYECIAGTVVDRAGAPIAGVEVGASQAVFVCHGNSYGETVARTKTGADGRFELKDVPRFHISFHLNGDDVVPSEAKVDGGVAPLEQRFVVARRCHLRIEVDPARGVTAFRVRNAAGDEVQILELTSGGSLSRNRWPLKDGRSTVLAVSEDAVTAVLENTAGDEIVRLPLTFVAGEVSVVRY